MAAFHPHEGSDLSRALGGADFGRGRREHEVVTMTPDLLPHGVDLAQGAFDDLRT